MMRIFVAPRFVVFLTTLFGMASLSGCSEREHSPALSSPHQNQLNSGRKFTMDDLRIRIGSQTLLSANIVTMYEWETLNE